MSKIIDIEALSKMPITDEFAKILFGDNVIKRNIKIKSNFKSSRNLVVGSIKQGICFIHERDGNLDSIHISPLGSIIYRWNECIVETSNAFQIVRYIDNYLNSLAKIDKVVIDKMRDVIIIEKLKSDNIIEVGSKLYCGYCGDIMGECEKELQFPFPTSQFTASLKNMSFHITNTGFHHKTCGHSMFSFTKKWSFISIEKYNEGVKELQNKSTRVSEKWINIVEEVEKKRE